MIPILRKPNRGGMSESHRSRNYVIDLSPGEGCCIDHSYCRTNDGHTIDDIRVFAQDGSLLYVTSPHGGGYTVIGSKLLTLSVHDTKAVPSTIFMKHDEIFTLSSNLEDVNIRLMFKTSCDSANLTVSIVKMKSL